MLKPYAALLLVPFLSFACSKKKSDDGGGDSAEELGSTPKVESKEQPDAQTIQNGGEVIDVDNDEEEPEPTFNGPGTMDLRPDAPLPSGFPTLTTIDPRTYVPSGTYTPGGGRLSRNFLSGQVAIPDDGRSHMLPACARPFAAPNNTGADTTVDGNLSTWTSRSVIAIDKAGDAGNDASDIREVLFSKDASSIRIGVKVAGTVSNVGTLTQRVVVIFSSLEIPGDSSSTPGATQQLILEMWGPQLKDYQFNTYPGSGTVYDLAVSGNSLELRIEKSEVESLMAGGPYTVEVIGIGLTPSSDWKRDNVGVHVVGLTDDYACMVDMPNADRTITTSKMVVMRRADPTVSANAAEQIYRAMVHGSRAAEYVAKEHLEFWDTINFTVVKQMAPAGVNVSNAGIFVEDDVTNPFGETGDPTYLTFVAAHEYLHSFNGGDYGLSENWMREGHSNWLATRALGSYFGPQVAARWFDMDLREFLDAEATHGVQTIANDSWGEAPYSGLFYYHKAATLYELMQTKTSYDVFLDGVLRVGRDGTAFTGRDEFLTAYKGLSNYKGQPSDNLTSGWWGGNYASSVLPLSLLDDQDHDGLLTFQETAMGSSATNPDADGDAVSDLFEKNIGTSPKTSQDHTFLAQDNLLTDWSKWAPSWLHTELRSENSAAPCGEFTKLVRYGAVVKEGWVYISAEVQRAPTGAEDLTIVTFLNGGPEQIVMQHGESIIWHLNPSTRPAQTMLPFTGKTVEIAYNAAWLGWANGAKPNGLVLNVATFSGGTQCDLGANITP